jgi:hypothetical protein
MLSAERLERIFGCPCGWRGRHGQCAAFRPGELTFHPATGASGVRPGGRDQLAPRDSGDVAAGTGCGRWRGRGARQPPRTQGPRPKDAAKLPPRDGETPANFGCSIQVIRPLCSPRLLAPAYVAWS